jgi:exodeoxyribonuclease VII large subunit
MASPYTIDQTVTSTPLSVTELTNQLKNLLETRFFSLHLQGEISNFKPNSSGHLYFDLKDSGAKIGAVMFRGQATTLSRLPKEGDRVIVKGAISVYAPHGRYQIVVNSLQFAGHGELLLKLEELKKKLASLGWFEKERKKPLPKFPKAIGVVTSPTGAVIRDILNVLSRRCKGFHLILNPVPVQGNEAAPQIAAAIEEFNRLRTVDVIIVCRGGGSLEDLWPFNEEKVAAAIYASTIPIISAVGHETDFTLADFVADVRAPTPSAAAEIVSAETVAHLELLKKTRLSLHHGLFHLLKRTQERLKRFSSHPFFSTPYALTGPSLQRLDEIKKQLDMQIQHAMGQKKLLIKSKQKELLALNPKTQLGHMKFALKEFEKKLALAMKTRLEKKESDLKSLVLRLKSLDPKNVLKRGYAILFAQKGGSVIVSAQSLVAGDKVHATLSDGTVNLQVVNGRDEF